MKLGIVFFILFATLSVYAQQPGRDFTLDSISYFYTIDNKTYPGKYSFQGSETGSIRQYQKLVFKKTNQVIMPVAKSKLFSYESRKHIMFSGELLNGKKVGAWKKYSDCGTDYYDDCSYWTVLSVKYFADTTEYWTFRERVVCANDSSRVYGEIYTGGHYQVYFECFNKKECNFWVENESKVFMKGSYSDFDMLVSQFESGMYDREIGDFIKK